MLLSLQLMGILLVTLTHGDDCPIFFSPPEVVVKYGDSVSVNCFTNIINQGLKWEGFEAELEMTSLTVDEIKDWEIQPSCIMLFNETECSQNLTITIYRTPDSVSISTVNNIMTEGFQYELQCDIVNVAPIKNLIVKWYKGETLVHQETFTDTIKTPVSKTSTLQITPDRDDDGVQYRCEAELDLGADGPQPPPTVKSNPLSITVYSICTFLQLNPQRVVVRYDSPVSVDCSTNVTHDGMGWEASEGEVPMSRDKLVTWRVSNLRHWEIEPQCFINYNKKQCEVYLPVTVYKTPDSVSISTIDHTGPMTENTQYQLQCDIVNVAPVKNLIVKWYKEETLVYNETFTDTIKTPVNKTSTLQITPDRDDDGVQYRCEAELDLGADGPRPSPTVTSDHIQITVHYKPKIDSCKDWTTKTGTSLSLYPSNFSSVMGNPPPIISWSRGSSLNVQNKTLDKHDSGEYKITASNKKGESSCSINITVECEYQRSSRTTMLKTDLYLVQFNIEDCFLLYTDPPQINCSKNSQIKANTPFELPCVVYGLPEPRISLYKDGRRIPFPYYPRWNDSGLYHVTASNEHGGVNYTLKFNILYAPVFDTTPEKVAVAEDSNITVKCSSFGNPEPDMWLSFGNVKASTGRRSITFNIQKATSTNAGDYICSATNKFGHREKIFSVEIKETSSSRYIIPVCILIVLVALIIIILLCVYARKKKKSSGQYEIQSEHELKMLNNKGPK